MQTSDSKAGERSTEWLGPVLEAVRALRFGSVELTIHDARVVQIERRERIRLPEADLQTKTDRSGGGYNQQERIDGN